MCACVCICQFLELLIFVIDVRGVKVRKVINQQHDTLHRNKCSLRYYIQAGHTAWHPAGKTEALFAVEETVREISCK